ncbi:MAG TPA: hypothetical protein VMV99_00570 [Rhodanobacter sp.]|nr:hypothetical protein [Rhodanobacter sp.]
MAGDWIKMRIDLGEDPAVIGMADALGLDEFAVVGRLHALWGWVDSQSRDGHASGVTEKWIDRKVQREGFAEAMACAGWLRVTESGVEFPHFDRHNGETAKQRGLAAMRQKRSRENVTQSVTQSVTDESRSDRDANVTREEKRRDRSSLEQRAARSTARSADRFDEFWAAYPVKKGRAKALKTWTTKKLDAIADKIIADVKQRIAEDRQWLDGYAPHGSTYVNGCGWEDAIEQRGTGRGERSDNTPEYMRGAI